MKDRLKSLREYTETLVLMLALGQHLTEDDSKFETRKPKKIKENKLPKISGDANIAFTDRGTVGFDTRRAMLRTHQSGKRTRN